MVPDSSTGPAPLCQNRAEAAGACGYWCWQPGAASNACLKTHPLGSGMIEVMQGERAGMQSSFEVGCSSVENNHGAGMR